MSVIAVAPAAWPPAPAAGKVKLGARDPSPRSPSPTVESRRTE